MNVLITGASGFIGSFLCDSLLSAGFTVIATARNKARLPVFDSKKFFQHELDVLHESSFDGISMPVNAVMHAATANDILSKDPEQGILLSTAGTRNVLEFCVKNNVPKMIFLSTFQVYGTELNGRIDESSKICCENDYGLNHLFGEEYVEMYSRQKEISGIVVRPSNVYGRFMSQFIDRWTLVPGCFCKEVFDTNQITLRSSGKQTRNFVGLHEVSAGIIAILNSREQGYSVFNIASERNFSMLEVADLVKGIFEKKYRKQAVVKVTGTFPEKANSFSVDLAKLRTIGFNPDKTYNLETEIHQIFEHLEKMNNGPNRTI